MIKVDGESQTGLNVWGGVGCFLLDVELRTGAIGIICLSPACTLCVLARVHVFGCVPGSGCFCAVCAGSSGVHQPREF
jgi:hypothetical protein